MKRLSIFAAVLWMCSFAQASRTVEDATGRKVTLADHVSRVVCLTPSVTDTVYALGAAAEIVGITEYTEYPPQAQKEKPSVGDIVNPSLERIVTMHPDVVIAVSTLNSPSTIQGLERLGIPVFLVTEHGLAGVYSSITSIGRALGRDRDATALVAQLKAREQKVRTAALKTQHPTVLLVVQLDPCITAGRGAFMTELIEVAGAKSVTDDLTQDWLRVGLEAIIPRNPDYIMLMKSAPITLQDLRSRTGWNSLRAVREGKIFRADDRLQIPSPAAFDGLEDLAKEIQAVQ
jgi:ABC-type Fe3+-hydroxamate transport system substrate-binding protein